MMKDIEHQKRMDSLEQVRSDRTLHLLVPEGGTWQLGEEVKDAPEFIKIHVYIFGEQEEGQKDTCQVILTSPGGEQLMK